MGAFTFLSDSEAQQASQVEDDPQVDDLLQEVRAKFGPVWFVQVRCFTPRRKGIWPFRHQPPDLVTYTLYAYTGAGIEYQVINLLMPNGSGSVFSWSSRDAVANYLNGMLTAHHELTKGVAPETKKALDALQALQIAASNALTGISVHNRLHADAPARRDDIAGPVISDLARANARAREVYADLTKE